MFVCPKCGSDDISAKLWCNANEGDAWEHLAEALADSAKLEWCCNECNYEKERPITRADYEERAREEYNAWTTYNGREKEY